jgi:hypothetical protein
VALKRQRFKRNKIVPPSQITTQKDSPAKGQFEVTPKEYVPAWNKTTTKRYMQAVFNGVSTSYVSDYLIFNVSNLTVNIDEINVCKMAMINMSLVNKY